MDANEHANGSNHAEEVLDCRGLACPQPVLETKKMLDAGKSRLQVLVDNEASRANVLRFAHNQGHQATSRQEGDVYLVSIVAAAVGQAPQAFDQEHYACLPSRQQGLVYVIAANSMGRGSEELGWALLQTYIQTIAEINPLPRAILFYNGGVKLVSEESGALNALRALQEKGVEILVCGTCLDFFQRKSALRVGEVSNMYHIMHNMAQAETVLSPL